MSLGVQTGFLESVSGYGPGAAEWFRAAQDAVNRLLTRAGHTAHREPSYPPEPAEIIGWPVLGSFPYGFLHRLRRALAHARAGVPLEPLPWGDEGDAQALADARVEAERAGGASHLICHRHETGFYVPHDFERPLIADDQTPALAPLSEGLPAPLAAGDAVGSAARLLAELLELAAAFELELDPLGRPTQAARAKLEAASADLDDPFHAELTAWATLYVASRHSTQGKTLIVFT